MDMLPEIMHQTGGIEELFIKHSRYAQQCEYRILWMSNEKVDSFIDIKVPDARKFCRRVAAQP